MVEETINEIETREEEYKEAEAQRDKRISKNERMRDCVTNSNGTIFAL